MSDDDLPPSINLTGRAILIQNTYVYTHTHQWSRAGDYMENVSLVRAGIHLVRCQSLTDTAPAVTP